MADKRKSFEEFYYRTKKDIFGIELVTEYVDLHKGSIGKYDGEMFCPECRKAELYFVHKTSRNRAHLRKCPTANHEKNCSYNYVYASRKLVKSHIISLSYDRIQDKLNSIINMLCRPVKDAGGNSSGESSKDITNNPMVIKEKKEREDIIKSLRRKRLNAWIDESDCGEYFVFYGKVKLKVAEREKKTHEYGGESNKYNVLEIYNPNNKVDGEWKFRTSLYRGQIKDDIKEDATYYIAIIGRVGEKSWQIRLDNIHAVKYCECD
ncbi:hypothetical protein [Clostridium sp. CTA-1]